MKIQVRNGLLNIMAIGETPALAADVVCRLPEFVGAAIMSVKVTPLGGKEQTKLAVDFVMETGNIIPGYAGSEEDVIERQSVWMVEVAAQWHLDWPEKRSADHQHELPLERDGVAAGASVVGGALEEGEEGQGEEPGVLGAGLDS